MNRKIIAGAIAALTMAAPAFALAQATSTVGVSADVQTQIQSLLSQIQALQQQLKSLLASSTVPAMHGVEDLVGSTTPPFMGDHGHTPCLSLTRNLTIGSRGDDVRELQNILAQDPEDGFSASSTGFFGPMTEHAMMIFQMHNGIASSSTGFVGPLTRHFFEDRCGGSDNGIGNGGMDNGHHGDINNGVHDGLMIRIVSGTISATDASSSITVQDRASANTITVNITASTTIMINSTSSAPVAGTIADLTTGTNVTVEGHNSSNGSVDALRITVGAGLPMPPAMDRSGNEGEIMHDAASTTHGMMQGFIQLFDPFVPHNDN